MSLLLHIYVAKHFHVEKTGSRVIDVRCERCNCEFIYELLRGAVGDASAPYYIAQAAAEARALRRADRLLARRLKDDRDLVACPKCQWVNADAIRQFRRSRYLMISQLGWYAALAGGAIGAVMFAVDYSAPPKERGEHSSTMLILLSPVPVAPLLAYALRAALRSRIDPNYRHYKTADFPLGTPKGTSLTAGNAPIIPVSSPPTAPPSNFITFRGGQLVLPNSCCRCLATNTPTKLPWAAGDAKRMAVPLCAACYHHLLLKWWKSALYVAIGCVALIGIANIFLPGGLGIAMGIPISVVLCIIAMIFINARFLPYRFSTIDPERRVYRIAFGNPEYHDRVRQACANAEQSRARALLATHKSPLPLISHSSAIRVGDSTPI